MRFRAVYVFDAAQTDGEPLPQPPTVSGNPGPALARLKAFVASRGIRLVLTEEAAKSFRFGRLTLTKGEQTVVETTLGLEGIQKASDSKRLLTVTFLAGAVDDGELVIWSDAIKGQPLHQGWGGFGGYRRRETVRDEPY